MGGGACAFSRVLHFSLSFGDDGEDQVHDKCLATCTTGSRSGVPLTRKHLHCLIGGRLFCTLGNLAHLQRTSHPGSFWARLASRGTGPSATSSAQHADGAGVRVDSRAAGTSRAGFAAGGTVNGDGREEDADGAAAGDGDLEPELVALLPAAGEPVEAVPSRRKRRRLAAAESAARPATGYYEEVRCRSLVIQVRDFYERFADHERLQTLVHHRRHARPGQFDSERLSRLEDFVLSLNLSPESQTKLYHLLHFRELTMPGAPGDDGTTEPLRESFKYPHAFRQAFADDIDRAIIDDGGMSCNITEGGVEFEAFIRNALHQGTRLLRAAMKVRFWSGSDVVAEPTDRREGPLDGDAFRLCEAEVAARHGRSAFVLAMYVYSESSVASLSGGTFDSRVRGLLRGHCVCTWLRGVTNFPVHGGRL